MTDHSPSDPAVDAAAPAKAKKRRRKVKLPAWAKFALLAQTTVVRPVVLFSTLGAVVVVNMVLGMSAIQLVWVAAPVWLGVWVAYTASGIKRRAREGTWEKEVETLAKNTSLGQMLVRHFKKSQKSSASA